MSSKFKEIEFKYKADSISLTAFTEFCKARQPNKFVMAAGWDYFYSSVNDPDSFCRHRVGGDMNQLTFKRKTDDSNNFVRTEHNMNMLPGVSEAQVEAFCAEFGYKYNMTIFKNCFIYVYDSYTIVYYVCYDEDMHELGRFLEIEAKEDYPWVSDQEAWDAIAAIERLSKSLGISPQARMKRSLYELFRK